MHRFLGRTLTAAVVLVGALTNTRTAWADTNGSHVTLTANAIRSVTVNLQTLALGSCTFGSAMRTGDVLGFPNGVCISPVPVQVTNGGYAGHIYISTSPVKPADGGPPWTPVPCTSSSDFTGCLRSGPRLDQFLLASSSTVIPTAQTAEWVGSTPHCDMAFNNTSPDPGFTGCRVGPLQHDTEYLRLEGPTSSTDLSSSWSFDVTWTAVP